MTETRNLICYVQLPGMENAEPFDCHAAAEEGDHLVLRQNGTVIGRFGLSDVVSWWVRYREPLPTKWGGDDDPA